MSCSWIQQSNTRTARNSRNGASPTGVGPISSKRSGGRARSSARRSVAQPAELVEQLGAGQGPVVLDPVLVHRRRSGCARGRCGRLVVGGGDALHRALGADDVAQVVLHRPARAARSGASTADSSRPAPSSIDRRPDRLEQVDHRFAAGVGHGVPLGPVAGPVGRGAGRLPAWADRPESVEFFFDPMCPWAYQTSLWIREIRGLTGLEIRWRFFSLEEINRPDGPPAPVGARPWAYGYSQMRVGALLRRRGQAEVDDWYAAVGHAFHIEGRKTHEIDVHRAAARRARRRRRGASTRRWPIRPPATEVRADHDWVVGEKGGVRRPHAGLPRRPGPVRPGRGAGAGGRRGRAAVGPDPRLARLPAPLRDASGRSRPTTCATSPGCSSPTSAPGPGPPSRTRRPGRSRGGLGRTARLRQGTLDLEGGHVGVEAGLDDAGDGAAGSSRG